MCFPNFFLKKKFFFRCGIFGAESPLYSSVDWLCAKWVFRGLPTLWKKSLLPARNEFKNRQKKPKFSSRFQSQHPFQSLVQSLVVRSPINRQVPAAAMEGGVQSPRRFATDRVSACIQTSSCIRKCLQGFYSSSSSSKPTQQSFFSKHTRGSIGYTIP